MADWARQSLTPEMTFEKSEPVEWFARHYPKIKRTTIQLHVDAMSVNSPVRKHHQNVRPNSGHDFFYKIGPNKYRFGLQQQTRRRCMETTAIQTRNKVMMMLQHPKGIPTLK
jgi:hypothetical protein